MKMNQRLAFILVGVTALTGIGGVATAAPAEAYQIVQQRYISNGPYLVGFWECKINFNGYEEWILRKRDGWYVCGPYW